jgi:hypothetical protein
MGKLESPSLRAVQRVPSFQEQSISIDTHHEPLLNDHFGFVLDVHTYACTGFRAVIDCAELEELGSKHQKDSH